MPCADCAGLSGELVAQKSFMIHWFNILMKKLDNSETEASCLKKELILRLDRIESAVLTVSSEKLEQTELGLETDEQRSRELTIVPRVQPETSAQNNERNSNVGSHYLSDYNPTTSNPESSPLTLKGEPEELDEFSNRIPVSVKIETESDYDDAVQNSEEPISDRPQNDGQEECSSGFEALDPIYSVALYGTRTEPQESVGDHEDRFSRSTPERRYVETEAESFKGIGFSSDERTVDIFVANAGLSSSHPDISSLFSRNDEATTSEPVPKKAKFQSDLGVDDFNFQCELCSTVLHSRVGLKTHASTHLDLKPLGCPHCNYVTARRTDLQRHIKAVHRDQDIDRTLKPVAKISKKQYDAIISEKLLECFPNLPNWAGRKYQSYFECKLCYNQVKGTGKYSHAVSHISVNQYKCRFCEATCKRRVDTVRHMRKIHKLLFKEDDEPIQTASQIEIYGRIQTMMRRCFPEDDIQY